jgi:hypothetical protein
MPHQLLPFKLSSYDFARLMWCNKATIQYMLTYPNFDPFIHSIIGLCTDSQKHQICRQKHSAKLALHFTELSQVPDDTPGKQQHQKGLITGRVPSSNPKKERTKERKKKPEKICCVSQTFLQRRNVQAEREREREEKALKSSLNL